MGQDRRNLYFVRLHPKPEPLSQPRSADTFAEALIGVVALVALVGVGLLLGGW